MRNLKKVLALVLAMAMSLSLAVTAGAATLGDYSDSDKVTAKYATAVDFASQLGILEGFTDGKYHPQGTLTRAQLATMVYRMTTADVDDVYTANFAGGAAEAFSDTAATAWYAGYVGYAADAELLKGLGDGTYAPDAALTGYAALAAFLRGVGYDEPGHNFVGADWTVEVAKVAKQVGALEGISNVDLNKAITREVAAQMIYNIMFAGLVEYTPAFGYQALFTNSDDLASEEFNIVSDKEGENTNVAPWGRPATMWIAADGSDVTAAVTIEAAPVATYKTAVTECQLAKDLGLKKNVVEGDITKEYLNGARTNVVVNGDIVLTDNTTEIGAQGTVTEIYKVDGKYQAVQIETWLAKVGTVTEAKYDSKGHEKAPANTDFTVYMAKASASPWNATTTTWSAETTAFAKDSYVLLNKSTFVAETVDAGTVYENGDNVSRVPYTPDLEAGVDNGVLNITAATPVATGKLTEFNKTTETSTVAGTTYDWAAKYCQGNTGDVNTKYDVYVDFYGNLIGLIVPTVENAYTILESGVKVTTGYDSHYEAEIVDLSDGTLDRINVASYKNAGGASQTGNWTTDTTMAPYYEHNIVKYVETDDGYELTDAATDWGYTVKIEKGTPRVALTGGTASYVVTDNYTVFAIETECEEYAIYTGYTAVPTIENAGWTEVLDSDNDGFADLVYVNATGAIFTDNTVYAYILPGAEDVGGGEGYDLVSKVVVNGVVSDIKVDSDYTAEFVANNDANGKGLKLYINADGEVWKAETLTFENATVLYDNSEEVAHLVINGNGYVVDADTVIWLIDYAEGLAEVGDASDLVVENTSCYAIIAEDGVSLDKVIIYTDLDA